MRNNTFNLVFCSIISVMALAGLYLSCILPTLSLVAFAVGIYMLCVAVAECGPRWGAVTSLATGFLGFIFLPDKLILFPYVMFFGYYPILKLYIEKINKILLERVIKSAAFTVAMLAVYFVMKSLNINIINGETAAVVIIMAVLLEICFILYDDVCTKFISLYLTKISSRIRKNRK